MALVLVLGISVVTPSHGSRRDGTNRVGKLFDEFDFDGDGELCLDEAGEFYYWVEDNVKYRYDDENDPDGLKQLETGDINQAEFGDRRGGMNIGKNPLRHMGKAMVIVKIWLYWSMHSTNIGTSNLT